MKKIFAYTNYRKYLKDYYEYHKQNTTYFSFRYFSQRAGFSSPSWLKFIINGERNLGAKAIEKFITALKLKRKEADYFRALVNFNQAKTEEVKNRYFKELLQITAGSGFKKVEERQFEYYEKWYHSAIRELVTLPDFEEKPAWIAKRLVPTIRPLQAKKSIQLQLDLGFLKKNKDDKLIQSAPVITTGDELTSRSVRNFHRQMITLASESIERFAPSTREVSSLTIGVSPRCVEDLKTHIQTFENELLEIIEKDRDRSTAVYQLNFQLFPLVDPNLENT